MGLWYLILFQKHKLHHVWPSIRILPPCNYCHHPWYVGGKSYHKALIIMFSCDGISDHASWNEVFHYWDTKFSWKCEQRALPHHPMPFVCVFWWCNAWEICLILCKQRDKSISHASQIKTKKTKGIGWWGSAQCGEGWYVEWYQMMVHGPYLLCPISHSKFNMDFPLYNYTCTWKQFCWKLVKGILVPLDV